MHPSSESRHDCEKCEDTNSLVKLMTKPNISKNNSVQKASEPAIGEITKQFIEENREILNNQKKQYSNKNYDKS
jgi:hypothetical protein